MARGSLFFLTGGAFSLDFVLESTLCCVVGMWYQESQQSCVLRIEHPCEPSTPPPSRRIVLMLVRSTCLGARAVGGGGGALFGASHGTAVFVPVASFYHRTATSSALLNPASPFMTAPQSRPSMVASMTQHHWRLNARSKVEQSRSMLPSSSSRASKTRRFSTVKGSGDQNLASHSTTTAGATPEVSQAPVSTYGKLKTVMEQYGPVAIVTYLSIYVTTLGSIFAGIKYGIDPAEYGLDPDYLVNKAATMLEPYSWADPLRELVQKNPAVADFALAWILTKFTEPVRALLTLAVVPKVARAFGRGLPRPPKGS